MLPVLLSQKICQPESQADVIVCHWERGEERGGYYLTGAFGAVWAWGGRTSNAYALIELIDVVKKGLSSASLRDSQNKHTRGRSNA